MQRSERVVSLLGVHRSADDAGRHRVDAHAASCVLDGQRPGNRVEAALGQRRERGRDSGVGVVDEAGGDVDHVSAAGAVVAQHGRDGLPRDAEESAQVDAGDHVKVCIGVVGERLGHEHASDVNQCVHPAEMFEGPIDQTCGGLGVGDIAGHGEHVGIGGGGDVPRVRDDRVPELSVGLHDAGADALRRAGDNRDLLF